MVDEDALDPPANHEPVNHATAVEMLNTARASSTSAQAKELDALADVEMLNTARASSTGCTACAVNHATAVEMLNTGHIAVLERMPWSSNMTFLVDVHLPTRPPTGCANVPIPTPAGCASMKGIYKPMRGERPLWDFPAGLHKREIAAFRLSNELAWHLVPPTVMRDGPLGEGSVQLFVPSNYKEHYFTLCENPAHHQWLQRLCAYDFVINSTDRKAGHILLGDNGELYAIDNGLSFHNEFKLRTVIWDWAGQPLPDEVTRDMTRLLNEGLPDEVTELLSVAECEALLHRAQVLLQSGRFPSDPSGYRHPWPLI